LPVGLFGALFDDVEMEDVVDLDDNNIVTQLLSQANNKNVTLVMGAPKTQPSENLKKNAKERCAKRLENRSKMYEECNKVFPGIFKSTIDQCAEDFLLAGNDQNVQIQMLDDSVDTYNMLCLERLQRDPNNFQSENGKLVANDLLQVMACREHCKWKLQSWNLRLL